MGELIFIFRGALRGHEGLDSNECILGLDTVAGPSASSRLLDLVRILIDESEEFLALIGE